MIIEQKDLLGLGKEVLIRDFVGKCVQITLTNGEILEGKITNVIFSPHCAINGEKATLPIGFSLSCGRQPDFSIIFKIEY